jgi:GNAT superfamily N-acetyltransferase
MIASIQPSNYNALIGLMQKMHEESPRFRQFKFDANSIFNLIKSPSVYCVLYVKDNEPIGFFIGVATPFWFGVELAGYDLALYILPEHRGGFAAVRMINAFEEWCKTKQCVTVNVGSSSEISTDLVSKLYKRLGYSECGFVAHKEI